MKKICNICKEKKEFNEFHKLKNSKDGLLNYCKVCNNVKRKKRRDKNKDKLNKWKRDYLKNNPEQREKHLKRCIKNYNKNIDKNREYRKNYEKNRCKTDKLFLLKRRIKKSISGSIKRANHRKKNKTIDIIGCSFEQFKVYIEAKWEPWMTWDNYGLYNGELNYGWDLDHIIPSSSAISEEEIVKLNHHTNFQPLCSKVNRIIKRDK